MLLAMSFSARSSHEAALDRAEAEEQTEPLEAAAVLFDGDIPLRSERGHHGVMMRIDASGPPLAAERLWSRVNLFALTRLPSAHPKAFCRLAM